MYIYIYTYDNICMYLYIYIYLQAAIFQRNTHQNQNEPPLKLHLDFFSSSALGARGRCTRVYCPWHGYSLEAQIPIYRVPVLKSLYKSILSKTQGPTIWVPGLLGV